MAFITAATTALAVGAAAKAAGGIAKLGMSLAGRGDRIREQEEAKRQMQERMADYESLDTSNLAAGATNQFVNLENTMEDLTVNQQQAQFEAQQAAQQRANIMQSMQGAAGGSGIAALAQAMANQGQLSAQRISASIGQQESRNQMAAAQQAGQLQLAEASGAERAERLRLRGAEIARGLEYSKTGTLLGMSQQRVAAANQARAQAMAQQMSAIGDVGSAAIDYAGDRIKLEEIKAGL